MDKHVFTFWEGRRPAYINLCMDTWRIPFTVLDYDNMYRYTDLQVDDNLKRFSLAQIADCVRVHVLRDQGGSWLDADTIMLSDRLPDADILGDPVTRTNTIGYLRTETHSEMYEAWAAYQDAVIADPEASQHWSVMGNAFTDEYLKTHDVKIGFVDQYWPETYMVPGKAHRSVKYKQLYFDRSYHLSDIRPADMLMLHNSWTPQWYKNLTEKEVLDVGCTLSNILKGLHDDRY